MEIWRQNRPGILLPRQAAIQGRLNQDQNRAQHDGDGHRNFDPWVRIQHHDEVHQGFGEGLEAADRNFLIGMIDLRGNLNHVY